MFASSFFKFFTSKKQIKPQIHTQKLTEHYTHPLLEKSKSSSNMYSVSSNLSTNSSASLNSTKVLCKLNSLSLTFTSTLDGGIGGCDECGCVNERSKQATTKQMKALIY